MLPSKVVLLGRVLRAPRVHSFSATSLLLLGIAGLACGSGETGARVGAGGTASTSAGAGDSVTGSTGSSLTNSTSSIGTNASGTSAGGNTTGSGVGSTGSGGTPSSSGAGGSLGVSSAGSTGTSSTSNSSSSSTSNSSSSSTSSSSTSSSNSSSSSGGTNPGGPSYPFVFSVFNDSAPVSSLQIYTSKDALNFTLLTDTGYTGPTANLRDPSIMKYTDGKYYVAFTTPPSGTGCCGPESSFSIASSADLKKWTTIATVASGVPGVKNVWAPEWFKDRDGSLHILVSVDQSTYRYEPTNAALTAWGHGTPIGIGPQYIDTFIVTIGATYHAFTKHEGPNFIEHATAKSLDGPWTFVGTGDWAKWGTHREAPALIDLGNGTWRFYCDGGSTGHEMYSDSADTFVTWTPIKTLPNVGPMISHGTVIRGD